VVDEVEVVEDELVVAADDEEVDAAPVVEDDAAVVEAQTLHVVVEAVAETPEEGTVWVLGKLITKPTLTELPTGRVPWYEVTVYWLLPSELRFQEDWRAAPEGSATVKMMLLTGQFPLLVTTTS